MGNTSWRNIRIQNLFQFFFGLLVVVLANIIGSYVYTRFDLTSEKRYTLSEATQQMLSEIDDMVFFRVYLHGDFPAGFKRLERETRDMINEFRAYNKNIEYRFINPAETKDVDERNKIYRQLMEKGLEPTDLQVRTADGTSQKIIFPGALVTYKGKEIALSLLTSRRGTPPDEILNSSVENLEFAIADAIRKLVTQRRPKIAFIEGHGEFDRNQTADARAALNDYYVVERIRIDGKLNSLSERKMIDSLNTGIINKYEVIIIAGPDSAFSEKDKFIIDQFVMRGGKVLWLVDPVFASMDSLQLNSETMGIAKDLNLTDMFFKYGFRLNNELVMDLKALEIPIKTGQIGDQPKFDFFPWYYFPIITPQSTTDPIVRNLNAIKTEFVSSVDFVQSPAEVEKSVLLTSSEYSRTVRAPVLITLDLLGQPVDERLYNRQYIPVAARVEGKFESLYKNRIPSEVARNEDIDFREVSLPTRMIVFADGDVIRNQMQLSQGNYLPLPLGYDKYTGQQFGNKDFILNAMNYLTDDSGLISIRSRELKLRLLNKTKIDSERIRWQVLNVLAPVVLIILFGLVQAAIRRKRYAS
ncbi:MAG TPA: gliding motility-associated ABC transporter substrate-binding protein GldG [Bacteroidales bacterium]|nr:gliding motility-associated ABC transporter substrate-binding protein GldG [Bacteroidales bacterium]HRW97107.1 gliding motility-associated ABC transporter substrate-binding protein GldG [Bacteroidales bacterium]